MSLINLIPVAFLFWVVFKAYHAALPRDHTDKYFQLHKHKTGRKFHNFFGVPSADL
ncbi:MAG: hypothetical protein H7832_08955 [Magnetococcus sp. DMHC-6]